MKVILAPTHTAFVPPVIVPGIIAVSARTVMVSDRAPQELDVVYDIKAVPALAAVTSPDELTLIVLLPVLQLPPDVGSLNEVDPVIQKVGDPVITCGVIGA